MIPVLHHKVLEKRTNETQSKLQKGNNKDQSRETSQIENRKIRDKISENPKTVLWDNEIDNPLARQIRKEREMEGEREWGRERTQITIPGMRGKSLQMLPILKKKMREYYEWLYANEFYSLNSKVDWRTNG